MLFAQNTNSLRDLNKEKAAAMLTAEPDFNDCCSVGGFKLDINFERPSVVFEKCTVIPGEAFLFYPGDGAEGEAEVCVSFIVDGATQDSGEFELYDQGDFTSNTLVGNILEICRTVQYPRLNAEGDDIGFIRSNFYVTTSRSDQFDRPIVETIAGRVTDLTNPEIACDCEGDGEITFGFNQINGIVNSSDIAVNFIPNGENLSNILAQQCNFMCFPAIGANTMQGDVYIQGELNIDVDYDFGQSNNPFRSTITLGPGSKINVKEGVTLDLVNVEIAGCTEMWEAITVEKGATLRIGPGVQSLGQFQPSIVSGGKRGIVVNDSANVIIDNTNFVGNRIGIQTVDDGNRKNANINIYGSEFFHGQGLFREEVGIEPFMIRPHFGEIPRAGIELFDLESGFTTSYGLRVARRNEFENLENGIIFNNSSGYVSSARFTLLQSTTNFESGNGILINDDRFSGGRNTVSVSADETHPSGGVTFSDSPRGIQAMKSYSLRVDGSDFINVDYGVLATGSYRLQIKDSNFDTWISGISAFRQSAGATTIRDNNFKARGRIFSILSTAIRLTGVGEVVSERARLFDNSITMAGARVGIYSTTYRILDMFDNTVEWDTDAPFGLGIVLDGKTRARLRGNSVKGNSSGGRTGYFFNRTGGVDLNCNRAEGVQLGFNFAGNNAFSNIRGNVMENLGTGLQVGSNPNSGVMDVVGQQVHKGNQWLGSFNSIAAEYRGSFQDVFLSQFVVDNDGPGFIPPSFSPSGSEFIRTQPSPFNEFYTCPEGLPPGVDISDNDEYIRSLIGNQLSWTGKLPASEWMANSRLMDKLEKGMISYNQVPGLYSWSNASALGEVRDAVYTAQAVSSALSPSSYENDPDETLTEALNQAHTVYAAETIKMHRAAVSGNPVSDLEVVSAASNLEAARSNLAANLVVSAEEAAAQISSARSLNDASPASAVYLQNEKAVNGYTLLLAESGVQSIKNDLPAILAIAGQCPEAGGDAVFRARSLAAALGADAFYDDEVLCIGPAKQKRAGGKEAVIALKVYPNPAIGELTVSAPDPIAKIAVFDPLGRQVVVVEINSKQETLSRSLDVRQLQTGVYVLTVDLHDGRSLTRKVSIVR